MPDQWTLSRKMVVSRDSNEYLGNFKSLNYQLEKVWGEILINKMLK